MKLISCSVDTEILATKRDSRLQQQTMIVVAFLASITLTFGQQVLPYRDPGKLVAIWERNDPAQVGGISGPDIEEFRLATSKLFSSFGGFTIQYQWLVDKQGAVEIRTCPIQASVLDDLGMRPVLGRTVRSDDKTLSDGATPPVWISAEFWQSHYAKSESTIGSIVTMAASGTGRSGRLVQIVGVLPPSASVPLPFTDNHTDLWFLLPKDVSSRPRKSTVFLGLGRLRPGVTKEEAETALQALTEPFWKRYIFERRRHTVVSGLERKVQSAAQGGQ
jgi:hypothetical protein